MKIITPEFNHTDSRRSLTQLFTFQTTQANLYEMSKGHQLGNHFHKETQELFYITKGVVKVTVDDTDFVASKGTIFLVNQYERHTIEAVSEKAEMMTFLTKPFTKENPDIWTE